MVLNGGDARHGAAAGEVLRPGVLDESPDRVGSGHKARAKKAEIRVMEKGGVSSECAVTIIP